MSTYGTVASLAGTGMQLFSQIQAARQAAKIAEHNARVAEANAQAQANAAEIEAQQQLRLAELDRQDILLSEQAALYRAARQREQGERILGSARAIIAASGLMLEGSPMAVLEETARQQEMDILASQYQARVQARAAGESATMREYAAEVARYGGRERLRVGRAQAGLVRAGGDDAERAGYLRAAGTAAQGLSQAAYLYERGRGATLTSPAAANATLLGGDLWR